MKKIFSTIVLLLFVSICVVYAKTHNSLVYDALDNVTTPFSWRASKITYTFASDTIFYSKYSIGEYEYNSEWPYVYGGRETADTTVNRIENGECPGGKKPNGGGNTYPDTKYFYDLWYADKQNHTRPAVG